MAVNVWRCCYCDEITPEGQICCEKCAKEHEVSSQETRINLGDITYSREIVSLGPTGIELMHRGHLGRRAIDCKHMTPDLQDQIKDFVLQAELAKEGL